MPYKHYNTEIDKWGYTKRVEYSLRIRGPTKRKSDFVSPLSFYNPRVRNGSSTLLLCRSVPGPRALASRYTRHDQTPQGNASYARNSLPESSWFGLLKATASAPRSTGLLYIASGPHVPDPTSRARKDYRTWTFPRVSPGKTEVQELRQWSTWECLPTKRILLEIKRCERTEKQKVGDTPAAAMQAPNIYVLS